MHDVRVGLAGARARPRNWRAVLPRVRRPSSGLSTFCMGSHPSGRRAADAPQALMLPRGCCPCFAPRRMLSPSNWCNWRFATPVESAIVDSGSFIPALALPDRAARFPRRRIWFPFADCPWAPAPVMEAAASADARVSIFASVAFTCSAARFGVRVITLGGDARVASLPVAVSRLSVLVSDHDHAGVHG